MFGALDLGLGLWMTVAPDSFFTAIGPFGVRNDHYARDVASFDLAIGAGLLLALRRREWAAPLLALASLQSLLHAANHLADIDAAHPGWVGPFDFALLLLGAASLAYLSLRAESERRPK